MITATVARALGLHIAPREDPLAAVTAAVKDQQVLLVLDNCEHLLAASAHFAHAILRSCRQPTIVATSREPLRSEGEQLYRLQPLSLSAPDAGVDGLQRSEAARLFVDRAREQDPHFQVDPSSAPAIARVCAQLDGIPLAARACSSASARIHDRRHRSPPGRSLRIARGGQPNGASPAADAAGDPGVELRPAECNRADRVGLVRHLLDHFVARSLLSVSTSSRQPRYHLLEKRCERRGGAPG